MTINRTLRTFFAAALLTAAALFAAPAPEAHAAVFISVGVAPPAIPVYAQPVIPGDGYVWTPGYWAWGPNGYYWVDGAWVEPPYAGALWTPGWWGLVGASYVWYPGYWGRTVGYYGGVNYGFGYFGVGFVGGYWSGRHFFYNTAYAHVPAGFHGAVYARNYAGYGRPGGPAFNAHPPAEFAARANAGFHGNAAGFANRPGINGGGAPHYNGEPARGNAPAGAYRGGNAPAPRSAPAGGGAPRGGSAPAAHSAPSGGGSRGGGGSHGGGEHR